MHNVDFFDQGKCHRQDVGNANIVKHRLLLFDCDLMGKDKKDLMLLVYHTRTWYHQRRTLLVGARNGVLVGARNGVQNYVQTC